MLKSISRLTSSVETNSMPQLILSTSLLNPVLRKAGLDMILVRKLPLSTQKLLLEPRLSSGMDLKESLNWLPSKLEALEF